MNDELRPGLCESCKYWNELEQCEHKNSPYYLENVDHECECKNWEHYDMEEKTIELTKVIPEVESNPESRRWIENGDLQSEDMNFARGVASGLLITALFIFIIYAMTGCTASVSIRPINFEAMDGGSEPRGWEDSEAFARELEEGK